MAEFFGPGKESTTVARMPIGDMEARVFKALLHFIYTESLPEIDEGEKVVMVQGLLVAVDRYKMERLKLICGDML
uniref:BTB domain-containing protein n=1 Tax=Arundo donax TaxID=35708 RepID=A0A0A8XQE8_ARUDO